MNDFSPEAYGWIKPLAELLLCLSVIGNGVSTWRMDRRLRRLEARVAEMESLCE